MLTVVRPLANAEAVADWACSAGFDDIVPSNWHVTIAKTCEAVDFATLTRMRQCWSFPRHLVGSLRVWEGSSP
ncbi:hypothetical protein [Sphingobium sp. DC-2]|jgi:hypothetical protein|uniref:hypothetical protein n=1 Tax=Sphingobium sp. DC-2 TaxID=1303256 RepID=UPI0012DD5E26|nr:hypothetical protein [Sphingobium sp. DC-2]